MRDFNSSVLPSLVRIVLGSLFFLSGLNGFLAFMAMPSMPEAGVSFLGALGATGYMLPLIKGVELVAGLLLFFGRFVPLALTLLAPVVVNITLFHVFLAPEGLAIALPILVAEVYLAWAHRDLYRPMLSARVRPTSDKDPAERFHYDHSVAPGH